MRLGAREAYCAMPAREDHQTADSPAPRSGLWVMALILLAFAGLSIFSNYQHARKGKIEQVTITPSSSPKPVPVRSPAGSEP